jgi:tripartite-type tricarboxylate transporter receptor subunit TctC
MRELYVALSFLLFASLSAFAASESAGGKFPAKPVTIIVPYGAGGGTDRSVRIFTIASEKFPEVRFRVVNMPGAGSGTGTLYAMKAASDGYVIVQNASQMITLPYFYSREELGWTLDDFEPIGLQQTVSYTLAVPADSPIKTLKEFVEFGRQNPGKIRHGVVGYGGDSHVAFKALELVAGFKATVVPFDSGADQVANIAGGHIEAAVASSGTMLPLARGGKARILAVATKERISGAPDIPTAMEQGVNWTFPNFRGYFAPLGTPKDRVDYLSGVLRNAVENDQEFRDKIIAEGENPQYLNAEDFARYLADAKKIFIPSIEAIKEEETGGKK